MLTISIELEPDLFVVNATFGNLECWARMQNGNTALIGFYRYVINDIYSVCAEYNKEPSIISRGYIDKEFKSQGMF